MAYLVDLLIVLERIFELIIQFGDAWSSPLVASVIAITTWKFRHIIGRLVSRVGRLKLGDSIVEFDTERDLEETREQIQNLPIRPKQPTVSAHILEAINISPQYGIVLSWHQLEEVVPRVADTLGTELTNSQRRDVLFTTQAIGEQQGLPVTFYDVLSRMKRMRDTSTEVPDLPKGLALEYAHLVAEMVSAFEELIEVTAE